MVHVRFFAGLRDLAGRDSLELGWHEALTVGRLREHLAASFPALELLLSRSRAAVGDQLAGDEAVVPDGVEVAFLPPVSGG